jgi:hypothetical protein
MTFKDIMDFIQSGDYKFRFGFINKKTYGLIERDKEVITVNYHLLICEILLHEITHALTGSDNERVVQCKTTNTLKRLTVEEIKTIVLTALMEGDEV